MGGACPEMTDDELRQFAWEFRVGILGERGSPEGMCYAVAAPLQGLLRFYGMQVKLVEADHSSNPDASYINHFWIELPDGRVLDPTFDQFCSEEPVPIYIGQPTEFHRERT